MPATKRVLATKLTHLPSEVLKTGHSEMGHFRDELQEQRGVLQARRALLANALQPVDSQIDNTDQAPRLIEANQ